MLLIEPRRAVSENSESLLIGRDSEVLVNAPPSLSCEVCVIVPVRNEAQTLSNTLDALAHQIDLKGRPFKHQRYEIILLANNCNDDSAEIARHVAAAYPTLDLHIVEITLPPPEAHIGRVRRLLMDEAYRRLALLGRQRGVIASTDGDSRVSPTWIAATLQEVRRGADAVGGRILTEPSERLTLDPQTKSYYLRDVGYKYLVAELESYLNPNPHDIWPRHYQHYGASLAVTVQMYEQVGGLPAVRTSEDVALYRTLVRSDARFRHSPAVRVLTSARLRGRAEGGLAAQLSEWATDTRSSLVESLSSVETRLRRRRQLRSLWQRSRYNHHPSFSDIARFADNLNVETHWLSEQLRKPQTFGLLVEQVEQCQYCKRTSFVDIETAIAELRLRLAQLRHTKPKLRCP